ncbi:TetR/AcrR family transcriptional regulator [Mobilitalea sibirica]|uniref:TetR/AcrR family transcriptional regulator n=1 Tax=Mobilitalea sibirica TaxID=1462919 RepID=A0A8J7KSS3_9FIRM|nr:TetR/AcrR family transcriptional regulator [Mobilitalea sibirica]MBH1940596.1 TetR/AcrR family transcriptional regulator [Mobilitalea sibirica]
MPRTKEQFEAMRVFTREKIHGAALNLFTQKGFFATSVQDIARYADISIGLMYRHYKSKEDLFGELVYEAAYGLEEQAKQFQSNASPVDLIKKFTIEIMEDFKKNDEFARLTVLMAQAFMMDGFLPQVNYLLKKNQELFTQTERLIESGQSFGQFKEGNPKEMVLTYYAAIQGLAEMKLVLNDRFITPNPKILYSILIKEEFHD